MPPSTTTTFSLQVLLGYGSNNRIVEELNKACISSSSTTFSSFSSSSSSTSAASTFSGLASQFLFSTGSSNSNNSDGDATTARKNSSSGQSSPSGNSTTTNNNKGLPNRRRRQLQQDRFFVASVSNPRLSMDVPEILWKTSTYLVAVFVPPHIIATCLEEHYQSNSDHQRHASGSSFWIQPPASESFARDVLLPKLHSEFLQSHCQIRGILLTSIAAHYGSADIVILDLPPKGGTTIPNLLTAVNGEALAADRQYVLKVLPLSNVKFIFQQETTTQQNKGATYQSKNNNTAAAAAGSSSSSSVGKPSATSLPSSSSSLSSSSFSSSWTTSSTTFLPTCPVCMHRIDPRRLGLPSPTNEHLCSKFCPSPTLLGWGMMAGVDSLAAEDDMCPRQRLLHKWPLPARCQACEVIDAYWSNNIDSRTNTRSLHHTLPTTTSSLHHDETTDLFCGECAMHKTLWVCLTCGFVGCGRYSNRHSVQHFEQTRHPYSLELATLRIWDYCMGEYGGFVQRADLLECPSSPPLAYPWLLESHSGVGESFSSVRSSAQPSYDGDSGHFNSMPANVEAEKSSKKAVMVGAEYEALLQSALEDQAMHYEGEIAKLRAELTTALVDKESLSLEESEEIEQERTEIEKVRREIDGASKELLEAQAQEAAMRATSQKLLSEQQVSTELLKKIQEEHRTENEMGKQQIEDLEQQIADLSANLRMRQQFSESQELNNAHIFGTTPSAADSNSKGSSKRGKKKGRFFRK